MSLSTIHRYTCIICNKTAEGGKFNAPTGWVHTRLPWRQYCDNQLHVHEADICHGCSDKLGMLAAQLMFENNKRYKDKPLHDTMEALTDEESRFKFNPETKQLHYDDEPGYLHNLERQKAEQDYERVIQKRVEEELKKRDTV